MAKQTLDDMLPGGESPQDAAPNVDPAAPRASYGTDKKFDASEVIVPRLSIAQGLSPDVRDRKAEVGDFLMMGMDPVKSVTLIVAGHTAQRRFVEQGSQRARCWSPDAIQGHGDPGIMCDGCPHSRWRDSGKKDPQGRIINLRPECDEVDSWLVFSVTHGMPAIWNLKGVSLKASKFVKTLANGMGMGAFAIDVTAVSKTSGSRAWHEPEVKINTSISPDECRAYTRIATGAVQVAGALPATADTD